MTPNDAFLIRLCEGQHMLETVMTDSELRDSAGRGDGV